MRHPMRDSSLTEEEVREARAYLALRSRRTATGCLEWTLSLNRPGAAGRPIAWLHGRRFLAYRLAWAVDHGPIPGAAILCHRCDNPKCIDTGHLFLGTDADNAHDRDAKGRQRSVSGESHHMVRHSDDEVAEAVRRIREGATLRVVADEFGISIKTAWRWSSGLSRHDEMGATA